MKIAIVTNTFLPKWLGGTALATQEIAEHLSARGHSVHVLTLLEKGLSPESVETGVSVHRVSFANLKFVGFLLFCLGMVSRLKKIDPDIVHIQGFWIAWFGLLAKLLKSPYIVWSHGYAWTQMYLPPACSARVTTIALKHADAIIALSDHMKEEIQRAWPRDIPNISVIPNGINLHEFGTVSRNTARRCLGIDEDDSVILYVGRLHSAKGLPYLVEAINLLRQKEPRAHLMLVGEGTEREKLELLVDSLDLSTRVRFLGRVEHEKIQGFLAASDVFVLPSLREGLPLVLLEAMAAELPIVATDVGGIPSIIEDQTNGFLVKPRDAAQIADKLALILNNPLLRRSISQNNREKVQQYSWENVVNDLEMVYSDTFEPLN